MNTLSKVSLIWVMGLALGAPAFGASYSDSIGEALDGHPHLDIVTVDVSNDDNNILFNITLSGDPIATSWGKYLIAIDSVPGGDMAGNGWARPISMSSGMDYFIGSWVDFGNGAEVYRWDGGAWILDHATYNATSDIQVPGTTASSVSLQTTLSSLGLSVGDDFVFDVFTTGGGGSDSATDALSEALQSIGGWSEPFNSVSTLQYTVVPEPATMALGVLGLAVLWMWGRRRA